jgi:hypothetical protein
VDVADDVWPSEVQEVGIAGEVAWMVGESVAPIRLLAIRSSRRSLSCSIVAFMKNAPVLKSAGAEAPQAL